MPPTTATRRVPLGTHPANPTCKTFASASPTKTASAIALTVLSLFLFCIPHPAYATTYTWTDQTLSGSRIWASITSSSDGTKLAAVVQNGDIYTSTDSGVHWTDRTAAGSRLWLSIASSADGTKLAAVDASPGNIYTSTDSGVVLLFGRNPLIDHCPVS
jgi:photosystem II stability/assembly factor-like uncharacterized protein